MTLALVAMQQIANCVASEYIMKVRIRKTKIKYLPFKEIILIRFYFERTFVYAS